MPGLANGRAASCISTLSALPAMKDSFNPPFPMNTTSGSAVPFNAYGFSDSGSPDLDYLNNRLSDSLRIRSIE